MTFGIQHPLLGAFSSVPAVPGMQRHMRQMTVPGFMKFKFQVEKQTGVEREGLRGQSQLGGRGSFFRTGDQEASPRRQPWG